MTSRLVCSGLATASLLSVCIAGCGGGGGGTPPAATVRSVAISGATTVNVGATIQLAATATLSDNSAQSVTGTSTWTSSSTGVATVSGSGGLVQGIAPGGTNISALYQGITSPPFTVQVTSAPVTAQAAFIVTPDAGTGFNAQGQCPLDPAVSGNNVLRCEFDASSSTPTGGITSYTWEMPAAPGKTAKTFSSSDPKLRTGTTIECGSFGGAGQRDVKLTIVSSAGTSSVTNSVTFVKGTPC